MSEKIRGIKCEKCGHKYHIGKNRINKEIFPPCPYCGSKMDKNKVIRKGILQRLTLKT